MVISFSLFKRLISYIHRVLFTFDLKMPHIAAGSDFLNVAIVASLFRRSGAFFMPRSLVNEPLWAAVLSEYTKVLVRTNQWVEFFIEGRRSRSGRLLAPKKGMLAMCADVYFKGHVEDCHFVPIAISYDRPPDMDAHVKELLGTPKTKESFGALLAAAPRKLARSHGRVEMTLGSPISIARCAQEHASSPPDARDAVVTRMADAVTDQFIKFLAVPPGALTAAILLLHRKRASAGAGGAGGIPLAQLRAEMGGLRRRLVERGTNILDGRVIAQVRAYPLPCR